MGYCDLTDLTRYGLPSAALVDVSTTTQQAAIDSAARLMDGYFRARYSLPLTAWGDDVRRINAQIATWDILAVRGFDPAAGQDLIFRARYEDAIGWLKGVARQEVQADVTPTQDAAAGFNAPDVVTHEQRGWA